MSIENFDKVLSRELDIHFFPEFLHIVLKHATPFSLRFSSASRKFLFFFTYITSYSYR